MTSNVTELRDEIARCLRAVRLSCFGRKCLKECQRRMVATAPCPRAVRRRWGAAAAAVLLCLVGLPSLAEVRCVWDGQSYVCYGEGSRVEVIGGGSGEPVVVTNFWGVCTNCVNMSPSYCESLKGDIQSEIFAIRSYFEDLKDGSLAVLSSLTNMEADISTFRRFLPSNWQAGNISTFTVREFTNYVFSVENTQTRRDRSFSPTTSTTTQFTKWCYYNDGIYDYAQSLLPVISSQKVWLRPMVSQATDGYNRITSLGSDINSRLVCEECQPEYEPGGSPGGGSSPSLTNGNWCTFDQGEAIKELLRDLKQWAERQHSQLVAISNSVSQSYQTLKDGLFTGYTHIPTEAELGVHWQDLYLEGYSPNFHEYAATNVLARIELLLAGMSGVLTNSNDFAQSGEFAEGGMEATNVFSTVVGDFTNDVANVIDQRERNARTVGDSLIGLYDVFRGWSGTPFSRQTLVNSYSVEIGDQHWDVPSFEPSENSLWVANLIRVVCRSVMSVIYILFTVAVFIRFHIAFFQWVWKYVKFVIELMQGLFA